MFSVFCFRSTGGLTPFIILNIFFSQVSAFFCFVSSLCLNDETKHSALCSTDHVFLLFGCGPNPTPYFIVVVTTESKKTQPVSEQVRLGCQFLSVSGERPPSTTDSVLYFDVFLIHERNHMSQIFDISIRRRYLDVHLINLDFCLSVFFWLVRIFILSVCISSPCASVLLLKSVIIFLSWLRGYAIPLFVS